MVPLRPYILTIKNRLLRSRGFKLELWLTVAAALCMVCIYILMRLSLFSLRYGNATLPPSRLLDLLFLSFFAILTLSNMVGAMSSFFAAKDLPLLMATPVTPLELYTARFIETLITSSWMFLLFAAPVIAAFFSAYALPWAFLGVSLTVVLLFLLLPAALGVSLAIICVNVVSLSRFAEIVVVGLIFGILALFFVSDGMVAELPVEHEKLRLLIQSTLVEPLPSWLPSRWASAVLTSYLEQGYFNSGAGFLLLSAAATAGYWIGYLIFRLLFQRGLNRAVEQVSHATTHTLFKRERKSSSQRRALIKKEMKLFVRDPAQALQLAVILLLTFLYLYNFRSLRAFSSFGEEFDQWWQAILALTNVIMASCVTSAVATRFVFPAVSLEGQTYQYIRATPLSIHDFLRGKFFAWFLPVSLLATVLTVSGALAIQAAPSVILMSIAIQFVITMGIVGLGVGIGAVYARFDWDSASQISSSFGSLMYMFCSFVAIFCAMFPAGYLFAASTVQGLLSKISPVEMWLSLFSAVLLLATVNIAAMRSALKAGEERLLEFERG